MFIYRDEYYEARKEPPVGTDKHLEWQQRMSKVQNQAEIIIAKHRNGATADVRLAFHKNIGKFADLGTNYEYTPSNFGQKDEPSGFDKINITIDPGAAFGLPNNNVSGSAMNNDDDDEMPF